MYAMSAINPLDGELMPVADDEYLGDAPMIISESVDPSDIIKTTQSIRVAMVKNELKRGVPKVDKDANTFLQVLRDMDQAALTTRKIDVDERQVNESERLAQAQNELLRMLGGKNPFAVDLTSGSTPPPTTRRETPALPAAPLVPDVTTQGTQPVNYDDFVSSVEAAERARLEDDDSEED